MPLPRISEGYLLEAHAIMPGRTGNMKVAIYGRGGSKPAMPVRGSRRATPLRELRMKEHARRSIYQGKVIDHHKWSIRLARLQSCFGVLHPRVTPCFAGRIRVGVQQKLVAAHDSGQVSELESPLLGGRDVASERIVIQHEHGRHGERATLSLPHRIGILGREHANPSTDLN